MESLQSSGRGRAASAEDLQDFTLRTNTQAAVFTLTDRCHPLLSVAYLAGELCVPNIVLQEQKGTHSICRHLRHLLAVKEVCVSQLLCMLTGPDLTNDQQTKSISDPQGILIPKK